MRETHHLEGFRPDGPRHYDRIVVAAQPLRAWCYVYSAEQIAELLSRTPRGFR